MRIGVRTGGGWVSMGPLGWLILGPFIAIGYGLLITAVAAFWVLRALVLAGVWLTQEARQRAKVAAAAQQQPPPG